MSHEKDTEKFHRLAEDADLYFKMFREEHILELIKEDNGEIIQYLLAAYEQLAKQYYARFRQSLEKRLQILKKDSEALQTAVKVMANDTEPAVKRALDNARKAARDEYNQLLEQVPILLQQALGKLAAEWGRVYQVIVASRATHNEMKKFIVPLTPVVGAANHSVGIDASRLSVIPQIGGEFALQFFNYADNFMVLSMPIFALNAPWEWSIVWHEMAGYLVRQLKESEFETVNQRLAQQVPYKQAYIHASQRLDELTKATDRLNPVEKALAQHADVIRENMTALAAAGLGLSMPELQAYIGQKDGYKTDDRILDFHTQLQALRDEILRERGPDAYEEFLEYGWSADWLEELFEDAFSARFFGWPFLKAFDRILSRFEDGGKGLRHPPRRVRILVAKKIMELTDFTARDALPNIEKLSQLATDFTIEEKATKPVVIWRVQNKTDHAWNKEYGLKFVQGTARPYRGRTALPKVEPGDTVTISIALKPPDESGDYDGEWCFVDDKDIPFGKVTASFSIDVKEIPLETYMISLVARRIHQMQSLLARQTNEEQLTALKEYTDLINDSVTHTVQPLPPLEVVEGLWQKKLSIPSPDEAQVQAEEQAETIAGIIGKTMKSGTKARVTDDGDAQTAEQIKEFPTEAQAKAIGKIISGAMDSWVKVNSDDEKTAKDTLKKLKYFSLETAADTAVTAENPFIEGIKTMDYMELLGLRFTVIDFGREGNYVTLTQGVTDYKISLRTWQDWKENKTVKDRQKTAKDVQFTTKGSNQKWYMNNTSWRRAETNKLIWEA